MALAENFELLDALADQIRTAFEGSDIDVQVEPELVQIPSATCVDMYPGPIARDQGSAGFGDVFGSHIFTVRARLGTADSSASQRVLMNMLQEGNALSLADAIYGDVTLNGWATQISIRDETMTGFVNFPLPDGTALIGFAFDVLVFAADS